ncbi:hypothetical protein [Burkholderia vietnamiensis]|uniref:hypothetical protein n=1 Tax=Burkholderia vietnamiensis TaxID=60552 RepID=UPI001B9F55C1|nr:hypothetical protein [Burkholderia vietnamiensis]MBR8005603.1 hypothetical protein [Burkholderia vietnamiensis]
MINFNIGDVHPSVPHLFADIAELLVIVGYNDRGRLHKNDLLSVRQGGRISPDVVDEEALEDARAPDDASRRDRYERQVEDVWQQLSYRASTLGQAYPFELHGDEVRSRAELSNSARVYRLLLACSRLRSFAASAGLAQRWARFFTETCKVAARGLMPEHASSSIRVFDANSDDRRTFYGTDLRQALRVLGRQLGAHSIHEEECDKAGHAGDAGLDIVAAVEFGDGVPSSYAIVGQCGAQETGWPKKTLEAYPVRYRSYFNVLLDWPTAMFTPVLYRDADGKWVDTQPASGVLLLDRVRIISLLSMVNAFDAVTNTEWLPQFEETLAEFTAAT